MSDLFHTFLRDLEREQGQPMVLRGLRGFDLLFEPDLPVWSHLSDKDSALVTETWIADAADFPDVTKSFVFNAMLEMNCLACLRNQAVFALDAEARLVLYRSDPLQGYTAQAYLKHLSVLRDQVLRMRRLLLVLNPQMQIAI